jgi:hypothetical protein
MEIEQCDWTAPGGKALLHKALSHKTDWTRMAQTAASELGATLMNHGNDFMGMGGFGRVVKCLVGNEMCALKMVTSYSAIDEPVAVAREFSALRSCGNTLPNLVIKLKCASPFESLHEDKPPYFAAYVMELGEPVEANSPKDRKGILEALLELHMSSWIHGDARVSNIVKIGQRGGHRWIDFRDAFQFSVNGYQAVERDTQKCVESVYKRVSPGFKILEGVNAAITKYARNFEANKQGEQARTDFRALIELCENQLN